jgi:hypothetical protein
MSQVTIGNEKAEIDAWSSRMVTAKVFPRRKK